MYDCDDVVVSVDSGAWVANLVVPFHQPFSPVQENCDIQTATTGTISSWFGGFFDAKPREVSTENAMDISFEKGGKKPTNWMETMTAKICMLVPLAYGCPDDSDNNGTIPNNRAVTPSVSPGCM